MKLAFRSPRHCGEILAAALLALSASPAGAADSLPTEMAGWFRPPSEFAEKFGTFRSPLVFEDGTRVRSAADWKRRREEILNRWHSIMGAWPALIERPQIEWLEWTERENFIQHRVRVEIAPKQTVAGYILVPRGARKAPAVLVPFYEPETSIGLRKPHLDFGLQLAKRGFVTLSIGSPGGDARKPELGETRSQPLSFLGYVAANCGNALATLAEVDATRIGIVGHSYGGKWAMFGSCLYDRFAFAVWSDPGIVFDETRSNVNYWDPWYLGAAPGGARPRGLPSADNPRTGAYQALIEGGHDLHELHALMAPRPFLVSGGSEDPPERWIALNHTVAVNRLLGVESRVAMTNRPEHNQNAESAAQVLRFFEYFARQQGN